MHGKIQHVSDADGPKLEQSLRAPVAVDEHVLNIRAALASARRQWVVVVATTIFVFALSILLISQIDRRYTATALVVVDDSAAQIAGIEQRGFDANMASAAVDTQVEITRSSSVLARAARALNLAGSPEFTFRPSLVRTWAARINSGWARDELPPGRSFDQLTAPEQSRLLDALLKRLRVSRRGMTSVVSIAATAKTADGAASLANAVANAYLEEQIEAKVESTQRAVRFLRGRVNNLAEDIRQSEAQRDEFIQATLAKSGSPEAKALLLRLESEARRKEGAADALQNVRRALSADDLESLSELVSNGELDLARQRASLSDELASASSTSRAEEIRRALVDLDAEIRRAGERTVASVESEIARIDQTFAELRSQLQNTLAAQELPNNAAVELFRLQREAETTRNLYASYLTKLRQVEQQSDFNVPQSRIVSAAAPPIAPSFPPLKLFSAASLLLALCAGLGLAFVREHFIGGVTDLGQLQRITGLPVIGAISRYKSGSGGKSPVDALVSEPLSAFSEDIRRVRLGLEAASQGTGFCAFVTSTVPEEGKTTVALGLARNFALTGRSTILIDGDLRRPSVHRHLNGDTDHGLIDFLLHSSTDQQVPVTREEATGLHYVLGGKPSSVPTDALLMSERFADLISYARENFDVVLVDTPPTGLVVDSAVVARHADLGIHLVRHASTSQRQVWTAVRDLSLMTNKPIYCILNMVSGRSVYDSGYSSYGGYYSAR